MAVTVPIEPLTSPCLVSMFLRSMTLAPTAITSSASKPAVKLQSLFNFLSVSEAFLFHLRVPVVSSISSIDVRCSSLASKILSIFMLCSSQAFRVGNKQTG